MSFSVKIAPGVRVRASSRGVRTSIGPRVARVHVGAGRTGISTGAGTRPNCSASNDVSRFGSSPDGPSRAVRAPYLRPCLLLSAAADDACCSSIDRLGVQW